MKTILFLLLFVTVTNLQAQFMSPGKAQFRLTDIFPGGTAEPEKTRRKQQTNFITWHLLGLTAFWGNGEGGAFGNSILNLTYKRLLEKKKHMFSVACMTPLMDDARGNYRAEEPRLRRIYLDGVYSYSLLDWAVNKKRKLHIPADKQDKPGYVIINLIPINLKIERQLAARGGVSFIQRGIYNSDTENKVQATVPNTIIYTLYGTRSLLASTGISLDRFIYYKFKGRQNFIVANTYADVLFAPITRTYASKVSDGQETETGALSEFRKKDIMPFGFKLGLSKKISNPKVGWLGQSMGLEYGYLPGLDSGGSYLMIRVGTAFGF